MDYNIVILFLDFLRDFYIETDSEVRKTIVNILNDFASVPKLGKLLVTF